MEKKRVLLGMSGGTDSSVAAILLQEQGFDVIGVTLRNWSQLDGIDNASEPEYILKARDLAGRLGIEHHVIDLRREFYNSVVQYFTEGYLSGQTPNPCAYCNPNVKWRFLNELAVTNRCHYISTGHYVNTEENNQYYYITKGLDPDKEQSFFLWGLKQEILKKTIFPLGRLTKSEVRSIAISKDFKMVAEQKESIGMCFISSNNYRPFLNQILNERGRIVPKGKFIGLDGGFIGWHNGYVNFTVGQRRGLGLTPEKPWYVTAINPNENIVYLGHHNDLFVKQFLVQDYHVINPVDFNEIVEVRVRYRKQAAVGKVTFLDDNRLSVNLSEPEWSIAPGQTVAFYNKNRLLGGGFIKGIL